MISYYESTWGQKQVVMNMKLKDYLTLIRDYEFAWGYKQPMNYNSTQLKKELKWLTNCAG